MALTEITDQLISLEEDTNLLLLRYILRYLVMCTETKLTFGKKRYKGVSKFTASCSSFSNRDTDRDMAKVTTRVDTLRQLRTVLLRVTAKDQEDMGSKVVVYYYISTYRTSHYSRWKQILILIRH